MNTRMVEDTAEHPGLAQRWKELCADDNTHLGGEDHLLYALLRGQDPARAFSPVRKPTKLANGVQRWQGLMRAAENIRHRIFYLSMRRKKFPEMEEDDRYGLEFILRDEATATSVSESIKALLDWARGQS